MKGIKIFGITAILCMMMSLPAMAATNGWVAENGGLVYYSNGVKATNAWADAGANYVYVGGDGKAYTDISISKSIIGNKGAVITSSQMVNAAANPTPVVVSTPVAPLPVVSIPVLYPYVPDNYGTAEEVAKARAFNEDNMYQRHYYNAGYEQYDDSEHKAFCACGAWTLEGHNWVEKEYDDKKNEVRCSACGQRG